MLVSLNPGHPLQIAAKHGDGWDEESLLSQHGLTATTMSTPSRVGLLRRKNASKAAAIDVLNLCRRSYWEPTGASDHLFHKRSVAYARALLWVLGVEEDWKAHCWFTDLVKCSTVKESGQNLPAGAVTNCAQHLQKELEFVRPSIVAALGINVEAPLRQALELAGSAASVVRLLHPSRWRRLTTERQQQSFLGLSDLKRDPNSRSFRKFLAALQEELSGRR